METIIHKYFEKSKYIKKEVIKHIDNLESLSDKE